jgi:tetratricopeptide (TPR) repeat protein
MYTTFVIVLALAASASLCGWMWHQTYATEGRATIHWAWGGLAVGALVIATVAIVPLLQQQMTSFTPAAEEAHELSTVPWPKQESVLAGPTRPITVTLTLAQDAVREREWSRALQLLEQARSAPNRTAREDYWIAQFLGYVHVELNNYTAAVQALHAQLRHPDLNATQRKDLLRAAAQLEFQLNRYEEAAGYARDYLAIAPTDRTMREVLALSLFLLRRYDELIPILDSLIQDERAANAGVPLRWLRMRIVVALSDPDTDARAFIERLAQDFPEYRHALLQYLRRAERDARPTTAAP